LLDIVDTNRRYRVMTSEKKTEANRKNVRKSTGDCLKIPDRLYSGLPRVVKTGPEAPFCRPTASFAGVELADSIRKAFCG
jgi:hypothetical protein